MLKIGISAVLVIFFTCSLAKAVSSVSLQWVANPDPSVVGYNIYYGNESGNYTNVVSVGSTDNSVVQGLVEGNTYYFAITAYDALGDESDYSNETVYIVPGFLTLTLGSSPGDPMHIRFPVVPLHWYELQVSEDLITWTTAWEVEGMSNIWVQYDTAPTTSSQQFFRVVLH